MIPATLSGIVGIRGTRGHITRHPLTPRRSLLLLPSQNKTASDYDSIQILTCRVDNPRLSRKSNMAVLALHHQSRDDSGNGHEHHT